MGSLRFTATPQEKRRLLRLGRRLGLQLKALLSFVSYQTFRRWIREAEQNHSQTKSIATCGCGRRRTAEDIRELVIRIRRETHYGYTRILGELRKLGIKISRQTVKNILKAAGLEPAPDEGHDSWDAFLKRHANTLWQCDFVSKPMWTPKGLVDLYFLVWLHLGTRQCWISPCTVKPDSAWVSQQARNFLQVAEDMELSPQIVMRDNDIKFTQQFDAVLTNAGATIKRNTPLSPNLRAHVERFIQSLKHECLDQFVIVAQRHLNHINREWTLHYNRDRPHEARNHLPPACECIPESNESIAPNDVVFRSRLGGLLKSYSRRAA